MLELLHERHRPQQILQFVGGSGDRAIQILAELIERMPPGVTLVGYVSLQDADSGALASLRSIFDRSCKGWSMRKPDPFGQKISDFEIRIDSLFSATEEFQYELIAEDDGRITLFDAH